MNTPVTHGATHPRAVDPAIVFTSCELTAGEAPLHAAAAQSASGSAQPAVKRREVSVKGRRVKTIDVHAHCLIPQRRSSWARTPTSTTPAAS
jgi:hypothetical protein